MSSDTTFAWLTRDIATVKTPNFFEIDGPVIQSRSPDIDAKTGSLPNSYREFVRRFGGARLYRKHVGYAIGVRARPQSSLSAKGDELLCIGHFQDRPAYFKVSLLREGEESPVFEGGAGGLAKAADGFEEWLTRRVDATKRRIGKKAWVAIVAGPRPFSRFEMDVVQARKLFRWRLAGLSVEGDVLVEVANDSEVTLPFLTIGVQAKGGGFVCQSQTLRQARRRWSCTVATNETFLESRSSWLLFPTRCPANRSCSGSFAGRLGPRRDKGARDGPR